MIKFKYSDLSDGSTMAYKTFDRHYKSFEARRKQLEREEAIMLGLTAKMQELGEITYDEYNAVIAWMIHSDKSWSEILWEVFENYKFPSVYEKQGLTNSPQYDTIDSSKRGRKQKCVNVLTAEAPHRFAKSASICIFADADTSGRMMKMKQQKPTQTCIVKILRDGKGNAVKIIKIKG